MADDSEAWPEREGRKRAKPAWMQDHEADEDEDEEGEETVRRVPKKPKARAAPSLLVTCGPRKPADTQKPADNKGRKDVAKDHTTKEERALIARYTQLRALRDAQASSVGNTDAQSAEQAQNDQRMAAAVAALRQDTQTDERKTPAARKLPSMRRSNMHAAPDAVNFRDSREEQLEQLNGPQLELGALWGGQAPTVETEEI